MREFLNIDCMDKERGLPSFPDKHFSLAIVDPPYNINKAEWDKIENYIEWLNIVLLEIQRVLKENGSMYLFHNDMTQLKNIMQMIEDNTDFIFKQFIVWNKRFNGAKDKGYLDGFVEVEGLRNYQKMAEYIVFYTFQDETGLSKIQGNCVYPVREYIRNEILRAKGYIKFKEINQVLGTATNGGGVASAVLSLDKTVPAMITKKHYEVLRKWLNNGHVEYLRQEYEDLRQEYEDLRQEYEDLRYTFNNLKIHHSVWDYDFSPSDFHPTPKPPGLIANIIKHSSRENDNILDPFAGTGVTYGVCKNLNRNCVCFEIDKDYYEAAKKRIEEWRSLPLFDEPKKPEQVELAI